MCISSLPSTVKHLAYPMVLTGAWEAQVMTEEQMKQLHEGLRRMGKQFVLDMFVDINVRHNCGFRILLVIVILHLILMFFIIQFSVPLRVLRGRLKFWVLFAICFCSQLV